MLSLIPDRRCPSIDVIVLTRLPYKNLHVMAMHNGFSQTVISLG